MIHHCRASVFLIAGGAALCGAVSLSIVAFAQQPAAPQAKPAPPVQAQAPAPAPPPPQQFQPSGDWEKLPRMTIERQFAGPLRDTVIQRLRDPVDGAICYLYLPISAPHSTVQSSGFVQYGSNIIGSINCLPAPPQQRPTPSGRAKQ